MMEKSTGHLIWNLFYERMVSNIFPTDHTHSVMFNRNDIHIAVMCVILALAYIQFQVSFDGAYASFKLSIKIYLERTCIFINVN